MEKVKVIYILGYGHSGSTLLNKVLGGSKNSFSVGELVGLKNKLIKIGRHKKELKNPTCSCGKSFYDCKVWGDIINKIDTSNLYLENYDFYGNIKIISNIFLGFPKIDNSCIDDYGLYSSILKNVKKIKGDDVEIIVDSSKSFRRFLYLKENPNIDLNVIYLTRDGRGVISSMEKRKGFLMSFWLKTFIVWFFWNLLSWILYKKYDKNKKLMISYDKFSKDSYKYLQSIKKKFGVNLDLDNYINISNQENFHNVSGNQMLRKELTGIYYDQKWKQKMPKWKQVITTILCYIPNKLWVWNKKL